MTIWLVFDLDNGDPSGKGSKAYVWWFRKYKTAMTHRRFVKKLKHGVRLSMPRKATVEA